MRSYQTRWFDALPVELLVARLIEAARCGRWARVDSLGASERVPLDELIPVIVEQLSLAPRTRELGDAVLERLLDLHVRGARETSSARALARGASVPLEARAFGAALLARRGDADVPLRWIELLRDPRFETARLDGFLGRRLDALAERLWRRGDGAAVTPLVRDARVADRALRKLCAPLLERSAPSLQLVVAVVERWFHDELGNDRLVSAALSHSGPRADAVPTELLERAARLEYHAESAIRALVERREPTSVSVIGDSLFSPPTADELRAARIRRAAAAALVRYSSREAAELLLAGSVESDQPDLSAACRHALELLRTRRAGEARLRAALERCDPELSGRALELLRSAELGDYLPALIERLGA